MNKGQSIKEGRGSTFSLFFLEGLAQTLLEKEEMGALVTYFSGSVIQPPGLASTSPGGLCLRKQTNLPRK